MKIKQFEDIIAWQKAKDLTLEIYKCFRQCSDLNFYRQISRAVLSIMNNIAEGFERNTNKELRNFLYIAKGSCAEVRSMLYIASELEYISEEKYKRFHTSVLEISRLLSGFIKAL
jgi:four helix bundle protein